MKDLLHILFIILLGSFLAACNPGGGSGSIDSGFLVSDEAEENTDKYILTITSIGSNTVINAAASSGNFTVAGACSFEGNSLDLYVNNSYVSSTPCSTAAYSLTPSASLLFEGNNFIEVRYTDADLYTQIRGANITLDTTPPTVGVNSPSQINLSNENNYYLQGTCSENGRPISGSLNVLSFSSVCSSGTWVSSAINTSILGNQNWTITAGISDLNGNTGATTAIVNKDTTAPVPVLSFVTPASGFGSGSSVTLRVSSIAAADTVYVFDDLSCSNQIDSRVATGTSEDFTYATATEQSYFFYFRVRDGTTTNLGSCIGPLVYVEDRTAPTSASSIAMSSPSNGETSNDATPNFSGTISSSESGSTVTIFRESSCTNDIGNGTVSGTTFNVLTTMPIDGSADGLNSFYYKITDQAGNVSSCNSTGASYTLGGTGLATLPKLAMVGSNSNTSVISLQDNNQITLKRAGQADVDLGTYQMGELVSPTFTVNQGDIIESTGATYAVTQGFGTAPWASEAYAGKKFTTFISRYGQHQPHIYVAAIEATTTVQILQDGTPVETGLVPHNSVSLFVNTLDNNKSITITSDKKINVYFVSRNSGGGTYTRDARVLTPAATNIIGFAGRVTAVESGTNGNIYRQDGNDATITNLSNTGAVNAGGTNKGNTQWATIVKTDKPVAMTQIADSDGINASPSLPISMLATHYGIPRDADYVSFASELSGTVNVYGPPHAVTKVRTLLTTLYLTRTSGDANAPFAARYHTGSVISAGSTFECSVKCYAYYDDRGPGADNDETIMMGYSP